MQEYPTSVSEFFDISQTIQFHCVSRTKGNNALSSKGRKLGSEGGDTLDTLRQINVAYQTATRRSPFLSNSVSWFAQSWKVKGVVSALVALLAQNSPTWHLHIGSTPRFTFQILNFLVAIEEVSTYCIQSTNKAAVHVWLN